ncbi:hypothetical protein [Rhizobium leguminosarum]|uniref:hypothetical protein n=1 Tax=Rhizobium leguminosarum TaxID=384 RepID=UPI001C988562|nr:hypothetical protein [Rhizobium leguminosarum]MBY5699964.1 hypothetical protein [Rhizobium leguminosarum]
MTITLTAASEIQPPNARYPGCPICAKVLSIAEVIERHCENCDRPTRPEEIWEIFPGALPIPNPDSPAPP